MSKDTTWQAAGETQPQDRHCRVETSAGDSTSPLVLEDGGSSPQINVNVTPKAIKEDTLKGKINTRFGLWGFNKMYSMRWFVVGSNPVRGSRLPIQS